MRGLVSIIFILLSLFTNAQRPVKKTASPTVNTNNINIFLRLGDSNEAGGTATETGTEANKFHTVLKNAIIHYKPDRTGTNNGTWLNVSDSNPTINHYSGYQAIAPRTPPLGIGPSQPFAYSMDSASKSRVGIIKCALGGTFLTNEWASGGSMYNFFFSYSYPVGIPLLTSTLGYGKANIKAAIVRLGTNDCQASYNNIVFKAAIQTFVSTIRSVTGNATLPIYWVQVNANLYLEPGGLHSFANVTAVRAAISACANIADPAYIPNFIVLNYDNNSLLPDGIHYDQAACIYQGAYEALIMLNL
jgi:hypothetical protein